MSGKFVPWSKVKHHWEIYLFIVPAIAMIALFQYYPALSGVFHSFYRWNGADISEYVGFKNYFQLFKNADFWRSFDLAFTLGVWNVVKMIPALMVAVCIHRCVSERMQFVYRALFVVPMVIPGLVVVMIWRSFFFEATTGYLNKFLSATHLFDALVWLDGFFHWGGIFQHGVNPAWLGDPKLIVVACIVWGFPWVGSFAVLTYLARLQSIPKEIYEAAEVDGASWWTKFVSIEMPLIMSSVKLLLVFVIIDTLKDAGMILALAGMEGGPGGNATVPALFMLRKAFIEQDMGYACAIGIILTCIVLCLQKASNLLSAWPDLKSWQRSSIRGGGLAFGVALLAVGRFRALGLLLLVLCLPYGAAIELLKSAVERLKRKDMAPSQEGKGRLEKIGSGSKAADAALRSMKHLAIWGVLASAFLPLYLMCVVSMKTNKQFYAHPVSASFPFHLENWRTAYEMITPCLANSLFVSISATVGSLLCGLLGAYFFARKKMPLANFLWNAILVMMMMPSIANLIPLFRLLNDMSLVNTLTALILVGASGAQIFAIFVFRSFVEDIPQDLFEAAEIDGASHFAQMRVIVLPLAGPILGTVGVMNFISQWNDFVLPLIVIRDHARLPVMVQLIRMDGEYIKLWGPLMAGYAMASIPVIILFLFTMKLFTKGLTEGAVKG